MSRSLPPPTHTLLCLNGIIKSLVMPTSTSNRLQQEQTFQDIKINVRMQTRFSSHENLLLHSHVARHELTISPVNYHLIDLYPRFGIASLD
ncbi:hypothetical protein LY78DRAFT_687064 [Colletotrichum sublineola]|nr:hypothetical protein LY78DRAFT_687064 [Colletotrichum sublineola]